MTILAGFLAENCIIVGVDSLGTNIEDSSLKQEAQKFFLNEDLSFGVGCAGYSSNIFRIVEGLTEKYRNYSINTDLSDRFYITEFFKNVDNIAIADLDFMNTLCGKMKNFIKNNSEYEKIRHFLNEYKTDMIGSGMVLFSRNKKAKLGYFDGTQTKSLLEFGKQNYFFSGSGEKIAKEYYLSKVVQNKKLLNEKDAISLMFKIIETCSNKTDTCGGTPKVFILRDNENKINQINE